jgi:hypothetical protein
MLDPDKIEPGSCGCGIPDIDSDNDGTPDCSERGDLQLLSENSGSHKGPGLIGSQVTGSDTIASWFLGHQSGVDSVLTLMQYHYDKLFLATRNLEAMQIDAEGRTGIGRDAVRFLLEVNGEAAKTSPGNWFANSDMRLKQNMLSLDPEDCLRTILQLKGVSFEWNDTQAMYDRPIGQHFGILAQNMKEVFPDLVQEDVNGYLMTSYGTLDPIMIEAIRALDLEALALDTEIKDILSRLEELEEVISGGLKQ